MNRINPGAIPPAPARLATRWSRTASRSPNASNGAWALYVVNHGGRQSIEMFEVKPAAGSWALVWHGCEVAAHDYNDVAILPDGGFVGTYPTALSSAAAEDRSAARSRATWRVGPRQGRIAKSWARAFDIPTALL